MEKVIALLNVLVGAVKAVGGEDLALSLELALEMLTNEWKENLAHRDGLSQRLDAALCEANNLRKDIVQLDDEKRTLQSYNPYAYLTGNPQLWDVSVPLDIMAKNRFECIKAYRAAYSTTLRDTKETVEYKIAHDEDLFTTSLTTDELLRALGSLAKLDAVMITAAE